MVFAGSSWGVKKRTLSRFCMHWEGVYHLSGLKWEVFDLHGNSDARCTVYDEEC